MIRDKYGELTIVPEIDRGVHAESRVAGSPDSSMQVEIVHRLLEVSRKYDRYPTYL